MGRQTKSKSAGKWKKSYKHHTQPKKKLDARVVKKRKNIKSIQRAKEMEEMHRKQKTIEDKYHTQNQQSNANLDLGFDEALSAEPEEENAYDLLVSELLTRDGNAAAKGQIVESSDDSDEEKDDDLEEEEDDEATLKLKLKEDEDEDEDEITDGDKDEDHEADNKNNANIPTEFKVVHKNKRALKQLIMRSLEGAAALKQDNQQKSDTFSLRLDYELPAEEVEKLLAANAPKKKLRIQWPGMGQLNFEMPLIERPAEQSKQMELLYALQTDQISSPTTFTSSEDLEMLGVKAVLASNTPLPFTPLQTESFSVLNQYQDLFYPERTLENAEQLRRVYCLHALNHMLKTRSRILHHNAKLTEASNAKKAKIEALVPDSYRDQGLVRPKVLVLMPFRETAYQVVNTMAQLLFGNGCLEGGKATGKSVMNYERFASEYTGNELHFAKTNPKPEDYEQTFSGNTDDNFRIGMSLTKKCLKLYTDFYSSDILLASPLGLRLVIGAQGSSERDYDFLNSIELLIIDQAELIYAQNWENILHIAEHLHLQPQSLRDADFQRVRPWCLNGLSRFYRQTVLLSSHELPEFRALFSSKCCNYQGKVHVSNPVATGDVRNVAVAIAQLFRRVNVSDLASVFDQRFEYFIHEVLPRFRGPSFAHCMIYVPSYFDYVRIRNYLKEETISFVQICEYTNKAKIARARDLFFHSGVHFLLYSERAHFFRRTRVKGIRHLIMYQPPLWPHFYSEMINFMHSANQNTRDGLEESMSITVLYTKYDLLSLKTILGSETATKLVQADQNAHTFAAE